jgi:hypothetical protein
MKLHYFSLTALIVLFAIVTSSQEGFVPNRDLIMMLTGDKETAGAVADWLATEARELV